MKSRPLLIILVFCALVLALALPRFHARQEAVEPAAPELHIYLLIGQSNMAGRAEIPEDAEDIIDTVASINTVPFFFPREKSPGGREWDFHNNAESFLLIGEAMGREVLRLMK